MPKTRTILDIAFEDIKPGDLLTHIAETKGVVIRKDASDNSVCLNVDGTNHWVYARQDGRTVDMIVQRVDEPEWHVGDVCIYTSPVKKVGEFSVRRNETGGWISANGTVEFESDKHMSASIISGLSRAVIRNGKLV